MVVPVRYRWISAVNHKSLGHYMLVSRYIQLLIPFTQLLHQQTTAFGR